MDKEMQRVSLGLKPSYFEGEEDDEQQELPDQAGDEAAAAECDDLDADVLEAVHGSYAEEDDWRAAAATADGACQNCLFFFLSRGSTDICASISHNLRCQKNAICCAQGHDCVLHSLMWRELKNVCYFISKRPSLHL